MANVEVSVHVDAPAERVYDMVSDVTRMPEWSPETVKCQWLGGADRVATGVADRESSNREGMKATLERLKAAAERG